jgi:peptide/nickel transport system ATP-binding protein
MSSLLSIRNLSIGFDTEGGLAPGVEDIHLDVRRGEIVALVGESGSGKSITALSVLGLLPTPPARVLAGEIVYRRRDGQVLDLLRQPSNVLQQIRGGEIGMIFQEPMTSLNPVYTCGDQVMEAIRIHRKMGVAEARREAVALFEKVQLPDPERTFSRYPHQLSGGQRQRVMIAMAMSGGPSLLICDEPTTALDVTVQKTILELIRSLQRMEDLGIIFITHDLGVVAEIADRALVMYKGRVVEEGLVSELFREPRHPYTKGLLRCRPALHVKGERLPMVSDFLEGVGPVAQRLSGGADISSEVVMQVEDLRVWYPSRRTWLGKPVAFTKAVDGVRVW